MKNSGINILILGKTGVGKSTFCNYVFGEDLFRTGKGKPVTDWNDHFKFEQISHAGFDVNLFDSVGIETNNLNTWQKRLDNLIANRNNIKSDPNQWIHGAFYLINAAAARIEPTEINLINKLVQQHIAISVILTNADSATQEVKQELRSNIAAKVGKNGVIVHEVCSVNIRKRSGSTVQFGKDAILHDFLKNLDAILCQKTLLCAIENIKAGLSEAQEKIRKKIKDLDLGVMKIIKGAIQDNLDDVFNMDDDFLDELSEKYEKYSEDFEVFLKKLGYEGNSLTSISMNNLTDDLESVISTSSDNVMERLNSIGNGLESDNTWEQVKSVFKVGGVLLTLESTILEIVDDMFKPIQHYLCEAEMKVKQTGHY